MDVKHLLWAFYDTQMHLIRGSYSHRRGGCECPQPDKGRDYRKHQQFKWASLNWKLKYMNNKTQHGMCAYYVSGTV